MKKYNTGICCVDPTHCKLLMNISKTSPNIRQIIRPASQKEELSVKSEGCCSVQSHMTTMTSEESDDPDHEMKNQRVRIFLKTSPLPREISSYTSLYNSKKADIPFLLKQSKKSTLIYNAHAANTSKYPQSKQQNNSHRPTTLNEHNLNTSPALLDHKNETKTSSDNCNSQELTAPYKSSLESIPTPANANIKLNEHFSSPDQGKKYQSDNPRPPRLHHDEFTKYSCKKSILKRSCNYKPLHSSFPDNANLLQTKDNQSSGIESKQVPTEENAGQEERDSNLNSLRVNFSEDVGTYKTFIHQPSDQGLPVPKDLPHEVLTLFDSPSNLQRSFKGSSEEFWYSEPSMDILQRDIIFIKPPSNNIPTKSQLQEYTQINIPPINQNITAGYFHNSIPTSENSPISLSKHPHTTHSGEVPAREDIIKNGSTSGYTEQASDNQNVVTEKPSSNQISTSFNTSVHSNESIHEEHGVIEHDRRISDIQQLISGRRMCSYCREERTSSSVATGEGPGSKLKQRLKNIVLAIRSLHRRKVKEDQKLPDFPRPDMKRQEEEEAMDLEMPLCKYDNSHLSAALNGTKQNDVSDVRVLVTNDKVKNSIQKSIHIKISLAQAPPNNQDNPTLNLIDSLTARVEKLEKQMHLVQTNQVSEKNKMKNEISKSSEEEESKKKLHLPKENENQNCSGRTPHNDAQGKPEPNESSSVTKTEVNSSDKEQSEKPEFEKQETEGELSSSSATRWEFLKQWHGNDLGFAQQFHPHSDSTKYYIISEASRIAHDQAIEKDGQGPSVTPHSTHTDIACQINKKWFERQLTLINTKDSGRAPDHQPIIQDQKPDHGSKESLTKNNCCMKMTCRCQGEEESKHETGLTKETGDCSDESRVMCIDNVYHLKEKSERNITWALCPEIFNVTEIPTDDKQKGARHLSRKKSSPESVSVTRKQQLSVVSDLREDLEDIKQICKDFLQSTEHRETIHSVSQSDSFTLPELSNIKTELENMRKSWDNHVRTSSTKKNNSNPVITMNTTQQNEKSAEKDILDVLRKRRECGIFTTSVHTMYEDNEGITCIHSNEKELMDIIQLKRKTGIKESSFLRNALDSSQSDIWPDPSFRGSKEDLFKLVSNKKLGNYETSFQKMSLDSSPTNIWLDASLGECSIGSKENLFTSVCSKINVHSQTDNMSLVNLAMPISNRKPEVYMALSSWDHNRKRNLKSFHPLRKIKSCSNTYSKQTVSYRTNSSEQIGIKHRTIKSKVIKNIGRCVHYFRTHQLPISRRKKKRKSRGGYMLESHVFEIKPDTEEISRYFLHNQCNTCPVAPRPISDRLRINIPKTTSRNKQKLCSYDC